MDITDNIKRIREEKRISQAEIARRLNLDPSAYFRMEKRGSKLTWEQIESIAEAIEVTSIQLLGLDNPQVNETEKDKEITELRKRVSELDKMNTLFEGNAYIINLLSRKFIQDFIDSSYEVAKFNQPSNEPENIKQEHYNKFQEERRENVKENLKRLASQGSFLMALKDILLEQKEKVLFTLEFIYISDPNFIGGKFEGDGKIKKVKEYLENIEIDKLIDEAINTIFIPFFARKHQ